MVASIEKPYLHIGSANDLTGKERIIYRLLEMVPGALAWGTFLALVLGAYFFPFATVIFIILFDFYWLLKTVYFTWHLRHSFAAMSEHLKMDWEKKLSELDLSSHPLHIKNWRRDVRHLIILPYFKESYEIIRNTCQAILDTKYPSEQMFVVLSGERRGGDGAEAVGKKVFEEFKDKFDKFLFTMHIDEPRELAGKGANETWAARRAKEEIIDPLKIPYEHIIVSVFDVDTITSPVYFTRLTYAYLTAKNAMRTSFQPVPLFINNIWEAPSVARVMAFSSTFWHLMNQMRPERLVSFSSHAFPFKALQEMNFWQVNVVSEDSRIFWQGLLRFDGDWKVEPLLVPVSMDANVAETFWKTMKNIYLQQRRWAYGSADIPYMLYGFLKNKKIPFRTKRYWMFNHIEGFWSWATNSLMIFIMGWLPIFLGGSRFGTTVIAYNVPRISQWILACAMFGIITSIYLTLKLLPPKPLSVHRHKYFFMTLQWLMVPVTLIFSSVPAIEAQTRLMFGRYLGFWPTPKIRKGIQKIVFKS